MHKQRGDRRTCLNQNPKGFAQGHVLHGLTTRSVVITIPVVRPDSNRPETNSTVEHLAPPLEKSGGGALAEQHVR